MWLSDLVASKLTLPSLGGVNAHLRVSPSSPGWSLMPAASMTWTVRRVRGPRTLGTFPQALTFGQVRQLDSVAATMPNGLARRTPLLARADQVAYVDVDDIVEATYAKQGAGFGYSNVEWPERVDRHREHPPLAAGDLRDVARTDSAPSREVG